MSLNPDNMPNRKDFIRTAEARVASIELGKNEASQWHYHNQVRERVVCLNGSIEIQWKDTTYSMILKPG